MELRGEKLSRRTGVTMLKDKYFRNIDPARVRAGRNARSSCKGFAETAGVLKSAARWRDRQNGALSN